MNMDEDDRDKVERPSVGGVLDDLEARLDEMMELLVDLRERLGE